MVQDEQAASELARIAGQFAEEEEKEEEEKPEKPSNNKGEELLAMMDDLWLIYSVCGCLMIVWLISTVNFNLKYTVFSEIDARTQHYNTDTIDRNYFLFLNCSWTDLDVKL